MNLLKGYLTYIMATVAIVWGLVGLAMSWIDQETAMVAIWGGLAAFGIRRAIK